MMDEVAAKAWVAARVDSSRYWQFEQFVQLLIDVTAEQNLIAPSTVPAVWARHIVDSFQLVSFAPAAARSWLDIGAGAGLPGIVVAVASDMQVTLAEPRALRVSFLRRCVEELDLAKRVMVVPAKAQNVQAENFDVISARAVATTSAIFELSRHLSSDATTYILPKGVSAAEDMYKAKRNWAGTFHVEHSVVDPASGIIIASGVRPK